MKKSISLFLVLSTLAACTSSGRGSDITFPNTGSGNRSGGASEIAVSLNSERNYSVRNRDVGDVYYMAGFLTNEVGVRAYSGLSRNVDVGPEQVSGRATFSAEYGVLVVDGVNRTPTSIGGRLLRASGAIILLADFDRGTLTGSGRAISVNGIIDGSGLGGTVRTTYDYNGSTGPVSGSLTGPLTGQVGQDGVAGAFHAADANTVIAGGFVGE